MSTPLFIHPGIVISRNISGCRFGSNSGVWFFLQQKESFLGIPHSQFSVSFCREMQIIFCGRTARRRNHVRSRNRLRQRIDYLIHACTSAILVGMHHFSRQQGNIFCLKIQIPQQILIDSLYFLRPLFITGIRLALMQEDTFNHTGFLCFYSQFL